MTHSDCIAYLRTLPDASVDSCVTDPPYELGFMGKKWDSSGIAYFVELWREVLRVLKPGAHLLAFGGTRTHHRMVCAIEDAGFEIRDEMQWLYGSGFPKSLDVSKAIDKAAGAEREVLGMKISRQPTGNAFAQDAWTKAHGVAQAIDITAPATDAAKQWDGWGTALKPACEPICVARKPLEGTVAANVLKHGTGAINVDGCRVGTETVVSTHHKGDLLRAGKGLESQHSPTYAEHQGRWPANVLLSHAEGCVCTGTKRVKGSNCKPDDIGSGSAKSMFQSTGKITASHVDADGLETVEAWQCVEGCPVRLLDAQSGTLASPAPYVRNNIARPEPLFGGGKKEHGNAANNFGDTGGASRFFYTAKASRSEREHFNNHATVKPLALMRYLVRLVTPPGGVVLDMFAGSGTTLVAARQEGFRFLGCDADEGHVRIAQDRLALELPFET